MNPVNRIDPRQIFALLQAELPAEVLDSVFVVGSLAAAAYHAERLSVSGVKTKDADLLLHPAGNRASAQAIATALLDRGWRHKPLQWAPGTAATPAAQLPAIRLYPPGHDEYFIELLIVPDGERPERKPWLNVELRDGWYGLPSFEFLALTTIDRQRFAGGLEYAHPCMMAIANLLAHPRLCNDVMSTQVAGRDTHRSSKDLGRVLALAWFETRAETERWAARWLFALQQCFPTRWPELATRVGDGLRALLEDPERLDEAWHCANEGLLEGKHVTADQLRATAEQLLVDVVEPVEAAGAPR